MSTSTRSTEELVAAAVGLIATSGLDSLTLSQVAAQAGVSRATAYREFGDKAGLVTAVAQHEIGAMMTATLAGVDMRTDPTSIVRSTVLFTLRHLRGHAAFTYIRDHEPHWLLNAVLVAGESRMNLVQSVASVVAPIMADPADPRLALEPIQAAEVVVRMVLSHALIDRSTLQDEEVADAVTRAITHELKANE